MSTSAESYTLAVSRSAARSLKQNPPETIAEAVYEFITGPPLENPRRVGKALAPPLAPVYSVRRGSCWVLYLIDERSRWVTVTAISRRADACRTESDREIALVCACRVFLDRTPGNLKFHEGFCDRGVRERWNSGSAAMSVDRVYLAIRPV